MANINHKFNAEPSTNPIISQVQLPGSNTIYDIHDEHAVHSVEDLGLQGYLKFKGAVANVSSLPASAEVGDVYHVVDVDSEYIWVMDDSPSVSGHWEEFGSKLMIDHIHPAGDLTATFSNGSAAAQEWNGSGSIASGASAAAQEWKQNTGTIASGASAAAQKWTQGASSVEVQGSNESSIVTGNVSVPTVTPTTKYLTASAGKPGISAPTSSALTSLGTPTSNDFATGLKTTNINTLVTKTAGTAAQWSAKVDNGVLSFEWTTNTPTAVNISSKDIGTGVNTGKALTALGTPGTSNFVTSATISTAPTISLSTATATSTGAVSYISSVAVGSEEKELQDGEAAAQKWTQGTSSVTVSGTNTSSNVTGNVTVTGTNKASVVTGNVTVTGTNKASAVVGNVTVTGATGKPQ